MHLVCLLRRCAPARMSKHQQGAVVIPIGSQKSSSSILLSSSLDETGGGAVGVVRADQSLSALLHLPRLSQLQSCTLLCLRSYLSGLPQKRKDRKFLKKSEGRVGKHPYQYAQHTCETLWCFRQYTGRWHWLCASPHIRHPQQHLLHPSKPLLHCTRPSCMRLSCVRP